jgi:hypothetical protein
MNHFFFATCLSRQSPETISSPSLPFLSFCHATLQKVDLSLSVSLLENRTFICQGTELIFFTILDNLALASVFRSSKI